MLTLLSNREWKLIKTVEQCYCVAIITISQQNVFLRYYTVQENLQHNIVNILVQA